MYCYADCRDIKCRYGECRGAWIVTYVLSVVVEIGEVVVVVEEVFVVVVIVNDVLRSTFLKRFDFVADGRTNKLERFPIESFFRCSLLFLKVLRPVL
jgi:hypothetical protein